MIFPDLYNSLSNESEETLAEVPCQPLLMEDLQWDGRTYENFFDENFGLLLPLSDQEYQANYFDETFFIPSPWQSSIDTSEWLEGFQELESINDEQPAAETQLNPLQLNASTSDRDVLFSRQSEGCRENPIDLTAEQTFDTSNDNVRLRRRQKREDYIDFTRDKDVLEKQLKEKRQQLEDFTKSTREREGMINDIEQLEAILGQPCRRIHNKRRKGKKISIRVDKVQMTCSVYH
ncbi:hypothetical protein Plec18167_001886 [Paecilomyces lecythidis]|uniref:BZIP domain-containing protein n=1 Tax=Paecilomyces lecythidis TaxID=3004212 RepID=A0ABR3YCM8_9EURO